MSYLILRAVTLFFQVVEFMILAYCILSWFARPGNGAYVWYGRLAELVEPIITPFRKLTAGFAYRTGMDFAPVFALIGLDVIKYVIITIIRMVLL